MSPPSLSVVVPTCDRPDALAEVLTRVRAAASLRPPGSVEVIVADDGSDAAACTLVASRHGARRIAGPRRGPAANRNAGAREARGEALVFLDDDCLPDRGVLAAYAAFFAQSEEHRFAEGRILPDRARRRMDEEAPLNETGGCFWSCNIAARRGAFLAAGGFSEEFAFAAMEDMELRVRLRRQGHEIHFVPEAVVVHPYRRVGGWSVVRRRGYSSAQFHLLTGGEGWRRDFAGATRMCARLLCRRYLPDLVRYRGAGAWRAGLQLAVPFVAAWHARRLRAEGGAVRAVVAPTR